MKWKCEFISKTCVKKNECKRKTITIFDFFQQSRFPIINVRKSERGKRVIEKGDRVFNTCLHIGARVGKVRISSSNTKGDSLCSSEGCRPYEGNKHNCPLQFFCKWNVEPFYQNGLVWSLPPPLPKKTLKVVEIKITGG